MTLNKQINQFEVTTYVTFISIIGLLFFGFSFISLDLNNKEIFFTPLLDHQAYVNSDYYIKINPPLLEISLLRFDQIFQILFFILIFVKKKFSDKKEFYLLFILACMSFVPIFSNDLFSYMNHLKGLIQTIIFIYFLKNFPLIFNSCDLRKLFNWLSYFGIILCIYGLYQLIAFQFFVSDVWSISTLPLSKFYFNNPSLYGPSAVVYSDGIFRVFSIFKEPSNFAFVLNSLILLRYSKFKENFYRDYYFIIFLIFILLSQSYFNIFFLIIFIFYAVSKRLKIILLLISFACICFIPRMSGILFSLIQICSYYLGFNTDLKLIDPSFDYRFDKILIGIKIFLDFPLFGIGLNNLAAYTESFQHVLQSKYSTKLYVLNMYTLQHLVELGIISTIYLYSVVFNIVKSKYFNKYVFFFIFFNIFYQDLPFFSPLRIFSLALMAIVYSTQKKQTI